MTPPPPAPTTVLAALLTRRWDELRAQHPSLPRADITVSSRRQAGSDHSHTQWHGQDLFPVTIYRSMLETGAEEVLTALTHTAAHALAAADGVSDTSSRGSYHNRAFVAYAEKVGMEWPAEAAPVPNYGFRGMRIPTAQLTQDSALLAELGRAIEAVLDVLGPASAPSRRAETRVRAMCGCGRMMTMWEAVFAQGDVLCGRCGTPFTRQS
ncbi:hypothetical protein [Kitasatospora fiedleri]|uniref:hypothetical protein n=1 Tax=Kitasatospora fiedleri TaxID=2991545 RepID=UPI00249C0D1B|nr:hypothetical protein [Kitasatospora fiedleri]